jgi:hypothetical protein
MTSTIPRAFVLVVCAAAAARSQEPARPDSARRPVTLPTVETTAPREERVIFERKPNVGTITITGRELTSAPRFFGEADVLRAVRLLPGVNARNDYSVGMNVRGGEADQNLVLLDGYPIYNPFHMGGIFGAFVEPMVDRVDFMTGGFPAAMAAGSRACWTSAPAKSAARGCTDARTSRSSPAPSPSAAACRGG